MSDIAKKTKDSLSLFGTATGSGQATQGKYTGFLAQVRDGEP